MAKEKKLQPHRILREVYRHYPEFKALFMDHGIHVIEHAVTVDTDEGTKKIPITISFFDLREGLTPPRYEDGTPNPKAILSQRKWEAVMLNVIRDMKQRDVAEVMDITTVSVGQYVEQAMIQLAERYFPELVEEVEKLSNVSTVSGGRTTA